MNESSYRWVIVALGSLMGCIAIGAMEPPVTGTRPVYRM